MTEDHFSQHHQNPDSSDEDKKSLPSVCCYSKHCCGLGKITESWFTLVPNYSLRVWKLFNSNHQWDPSLLWAVKCAINLPSCLLLQLAASFIPYLSFITDILILTLLKNYRLSGGQMKKTLWKKKYEKNIRHRLHNSTWMDAN